jgi:hypothetical protein
MAGVSGAKKAKALKRSMVRANHGTVWAVALRPETPKITNYFCKKG